MHKKIFYVAMILVLAVLAVGFVAKREVLFTGKTMGTTYHIKVIASWYQNTGRLPGKIETRLNDINQSMSVFRKDSEISRFNNLKAVGEKFPIIGLWSLRLHSINGRIMRGTARSCRW
jgi:thiamine biosynthesis lipoprotein